jgi:hypothetical protein
MRSGLLTLVSIIYCFSLIAQNNFEGRIIYRMQTGPDTLKDNLVEVFLKGKLMLLKSNDKSKPMHSLFDFNTGIFYNFLLEDSLALTNPLPGSPFLKKEINEKQNINILNYETERTVYYAGVSFNNPFKSIEAWYSKKILFKIPDSIRSIQPPFIFFKDGSISLRVKINLNNQFLNDQLPDSLIVTASAIMEETLSDALFTIPEYFKIIPLNDHLNGLLEKFKTIDAGLIKTNPAFKTEVIGRPEMTEINSEPPPPVPTAPPKKKNSR